MECPALDIQRMIKKTRRHRNAGSLQFLSKFRANAGSGKTADHMPVGSNAALLEHEETRSRSEQCEIEFPAQETSSAVEHAAA